MFYFILLKEFIYACRKSYYVWRGNSSKGMNIYVTGYLDGTHTWIAPADGNYRVICIGRGQDGQVGTFVDAYGNNSGVGGNSGSWCEKKIFFKKGQGGTVKIDDTYSSFNDILKAERGKSSGAAVAIGGDTNHTGLLGDKGKQGELFYDTIALRAPEPGAVFLLEVVMVQEHQII